MWVSRAFPKLHAVLQKGLHFPLLLLLALATAASVFLAACSPSVNVARRPGGSMQPKPAQGPVDEEKKQNGVRHINLSLSNTTLCYFTFSESKRDG